MMPTESEKTEATPPAELEEAARPPLPSEGGGELFPSSEKTAAPDTSSLPAELVFQFDEPDEPPPAEAEPLPESAVPPIVAELREAIPYSADIVSLLGSLLKQSGLDIKRFLEIGCGDAALSKLILNAYPAATGVLLDSDEPSLSVAWRALGDDSSRMAFVAQDASHPDWAEAVKNVAPFDLIVCSHVISRQPDEQKVNIYTDIFEMLSPGGLFFNLDIVSISAPFARKVFDSLWLDSLVKHRAAKTGSADRAQAEQDYAQRPDKALLQPSLTDEQCNWLREIGFVGVECFFRGLGIAFFGGAKPLKFAATRGAP